MRLVAPGQFVDQLFIIELLFITIKQIKLNIQPFELTASFFEVTAKTLLQSGLMISIHPFVNQAAKLNTKVKAKSTKAKSTKSKSTKAKSTKPMRVRAESKEVEVEPKRRQDGRLTKAERTKLAILQSAEVVFAQQGYDRTTLDAVGEPVNVLGTAVLYHFKSKEFLYQETLRFTNKPLSKAVGEDIDKSDSLEEMVIKIAIDLIRGCAERPYALQLLMREAAAATPDANTISGPMAGKTLQNLFDAVDAHQAPSGKTSRKIDPVLVFSMLMGVIGFYFTGFPNLMGQKLPYDPLDPRRIEELEDSLVDIIKHMMRSA